MSIGLDRSLVGRTYETVAIVLDPARVAAFARVVGQVGAGVAPTMATVPELRSGLQKVLTDPDLGLELSRVLHAEQRYTWKRPFREGETLSASSTIEDIRGRPSLEFLTLRTEIRDARGELVCEARSTLLHRGEP
jgi:acyl dehydratase